ncbi:DEAD/DEAH box helicase [Bacillus marinisedimentorum]|uniref:DEAD/DEAH box helicase n=1 Tax=Bacillus marinisedimentorum TaxID=1821260 RepID=UPI000871CFAA|nr:DEAD/DEAH box helicase [Bacillus marinisedimentorum]
MTTFQELNLSEGILKSVSQMGFEEATPIQGQTIPLAMNGRDVIGQAQTGTGKTTAFGIPMIEKIDVKAGKIQGIVIAPTRELAVQVGEELNRVGRYTGIRTLPIYGGQDINRQIRALKKNPEIIVGTPGRLLDHINRRTLRLNNIHTVVLDEADEMLNMGFIEDIESILKSIPEERQTLLFSATMPGPIQKIAERFMNNPEVVKVKSKEVTVPNIEQHYIEVQEKQKFDVLTRLIDIDSPDLAIIFGRTKRRVDEVAEALNSRGYSAEGLHGDLTQSRRLQVLRKFKGGDIEILVATDVAARGLDITGVTHVYNFDIPQDPESYVHRVGRTGRAGKSGLAISFVTPREIPQLKLIEKTTKRKIDKKKMPSMDEALEGQKRITVDRIQEAIDSGNTSYYKHLAEELLGEYDSISVLSAALKLLTKEPDTTPVKLSSVEPISTKKARGNSGGYKGKGGGNRGRDRNSRGRSGGGQQRNSYKKGRSNFKKNNNNR